MNFFRWWMGYPQFLRSLPKHDGIFFLVTSRKNCQRFVSFLLPGLNQQQVKHGVPQVYAQVSYLAKNKPTYFRLVSQPCFHGISTVNFEIEMLMGDLQLTVYI